MSITKGSSTTMNHSRTSRLAALAGVVVVAALILAACGSSSNTSSTGASAGSSSASAAAGGPSSAARSKLVACLKSHGVTLPNRPAGARRRPNGGGEGGGPPGGGGGFFFGGGGPRGNGGGGAGGPGSRFNNPKFRAAIQACGGGQFQRRRFTPNKAAVTKFVACVKQHGYNLPTPNFSGKGPIFPATISRNKKFQAAAQACASDLRPQGGPGGGGPNSGSSGSSGGGSSSD
jgi:hypothetical protein